MRSMILTLLALVLFGAPAFAAAAATNTVCPTCDKKVDPAKDPAVTIKGKDGKDLTLAACCKNCAGKVEAEPAKFAEKAAKDAEKVGKDAAKDLKKLGKDAEKDAKKAAKDTEKAAKDAEKPTVEPAK